MCIRDRSSTEEAHELIANQDENPDLDVDKIIAESEVKLAD